MMDALAIIPKYQAYKESGVDWLGTIPCGWDIRRIKFIFSEINERSKNGSEELLSVSQYTGVTRKSDKLAENDLLTNAETLEGYKKVIQGELVSNIMLAWNGSLGFSPFDGIVSPAYSVYRLLGENIQRYFHYLLRTEVYKAEYKRRSTGVIESRLRLYTDDFFDIRCLLPPVEEQVVIANFLDQKTAQIDEAIAIKVKQIALLKERKQIIIQKAVTQGLDPNVPMKDSGVEWIGHIPEHWDLKKLKYICDSQGRIGFKGYTTTDLVDKGEGALTLGASHMDWDGNIDISKPVYIHWQKYYESPEIMVNQGDILIVQRGSTCGKVALVDRDLGETTINPSLVLLKNIKQEPSFLFLAIKVVLNGILNLVSNTAIPMLSQFQINNIVVALPPITDQVLITDFVKMKSSKFDQAIELHQQQIEKLKEYKTTLINSAVTGKIKVA